MSSISTKMIKTAPHKITTKEKKRRFSAASVWSGSFASPCTTAENRRSTRERQTRRKDDVFIMLQFQAEEFDIRNVKVVSSIVIYQCGCQGIDVIIKLKDQRIKG